MKKILETYRGLVKDMPRRLEVTHDIQPENEILINADCWCDLCQTNYPEWNMRSVGDLQVCEGCYDHFND